MKDRKLNSIIKAYRLLKQESPDDWIRDCKNASCLAEAIKLAANARNNLNKKHPHQKRISPTNLNTFCKKILTKNDQINQSNTFSDLYTIIDGCKFKGIGDLTVYDTTLRIGEYLRLYPERVYLHRGTKEGAKNLLGKIKGKSVSIDHFPKIFRDSKLTAAEIEDLLCIYKNRLKIAPNE